jgi:hypothetical protein
LIDNNDSLGGKHAELPAGQQYDFASVTLSRRARLRTTITSGGSFTFGVLQITTNSTLLLVPYNNGDTDYTNDSHFVLNATTVTIEASGVISADGLGYPSPAKPMSATDNVNGLGPGGGGGVPFGGVGHAAGGGHGGTGGNGQYATTVGGAAYGSDTAPVELGSSGGYGGANCWGNEGRAGSGGGAIRLVVSGTLTVDGRLSANGTAVNLSCGGGGSGGSLWITTGAIAGGGVIQANGANASAGGGGGGRIAIYYGGAFPAGLTVQANGGTGYLDGDPGTIHKVP